MVFYDAFAKLPKADTLSKQKSPMLITGLSHIHKANAIYYLQQSSQTPTLVVTADERSARMLCNDYNQMAGCEEAAVFPYRDFQLLEVETVSHEYEYQRILLLSRVLSKELNVLFCSANTALQYVIPKSTLQKTLLTLSKNQTISPDSLLTTLHNAGYSHRVQVDGPAQYAMRGGILDLFSTSSPDPVRVEFWGDEINTISKFDLDTQRRTREVPTCTVSPANEVLFPDDLAEQLEPFISISGIRRDLTRLQDNLPLSNRDKFYPVCYPTPCTLFDYFDKGSLFISEWQDVKDAAQQSIAQINEDINILVKKEEIPAAFSGYQLDLSALKDRLVRGRLTLLQSFVRSISDFSIASTFDLQAIQTGSLKGSLTDLIEELQPYCSDGYTVIILAGTVRAASVLAKDLANEAIIATPIDQKHSLESGNLYTLPGSLSAGFVYPTAKIAVFTQSTSRQIAASRKKARKGEEIRSLSDLHRGDHVVHITHGIGIFDGITQLTVQGVVKDYIKIKYAGSDVLYLPVTQLDMVSKYIGTGQNERLRLNKMGTNDWKNTKSRVKKEVALMAKELIALYAKRQEAKGFAFAPDSDWQKNFEEHFEFDETEDQLRSTQEIKEDMESSRPMERLLCGDVGFGKTEVALRAAFKCVLDAKQCALLCPTTILAWQHYQTVKRRMGEFPIEVELLSRFRTGKQQKEILERLNKGEIDIIIGTHRLVQEDVKFKDLGLAIIDEEQRFGVKQKERFKEIFHGVDILSLSATPIPRTLNMAMSGLRDMSLLEDPPQDRQPVQTYVMEHNLEILLSAITREVRRGGQVYYIHNRVSSIQSCAYRLSEMLPGVRIGVAHGQMSETALSRVWTQLMEHELDILVCTTIIETGVDLPNCNTLIIEDADRMGLSQLYQLRGRVGRSHRRAFAYFTFRRDKVLSEVASKRLEAIREFTQFNSGFRIALRDLEIRGAGSLLGERQHGHMEAVGYDMYVRLLSEAVAELQGKLLPSQNECLIDIPVQAHIPESYIENTRQRLDIYRKIAAIQTQADCADLIQELTDRFGKPSEAVLGLMDIALLRADASSIGFTEINQRNQEMLFYLKEVDMPLVECLVAGLPGRIFLSAASRPYIAVKMNPGTTSPDIIREVLQIAKKRKT